MSYEILMKEAIQHDIDIYEKPMKSKIKGLYCDKIIWINQTIPTNVEKACVLAEELGHYHTTVGDILDQSKIENRKQELKARTWAYKKLVPLTKIVQAHKKNITTRYELAEFLNITEEFLEDAINWYIGKYGLSTTVDDFTICFEPLGVLELFEY